jgi:hypothetical protein
MDRTPLVTVDFATDIADVPRPILEACANTRAQLSKVLND